MYMNVNKRSRCNLILDLELCSLPVQRRVPIADIGGAVVSKAAVSAHTMMIGAMSSVPSVSQGAPSEAHLPSQLSSTAATTPTASPRPSILRKRTSEG